MRSGANMFWTLRKIRKSRKIGARTSRPQPLQCNGDKLEQTKLNNKLCFRAYALIADETSALRLVQNA